MKSIPKEQQKSLLLNEFNLSDNNFDVAWINNIISKPVAKNIFVQLENGDLAEHDFYINFDEIIVNQDKNKQNFYQNLNIEIKKHISSVWGSKNINHIYNYYKIEKKTDTVKYLVFYFSNKKSQKILDHSLFQHKDSLIRYILDLLSKATLMETLSEHSPLKPDLFSGSFYLSPDINEKINTINVFSYFLSYREKILKFKLENKLFKLQHNPTLYDNICLSNKSFKYSNKLDARTYGRPFLNFSSYSNLKKCKFITQYEFYKLIHKTLDKFKINYTQTYFEPQYLYNNFSNIKNTVQQLKIVIIDQDNKYKKNQFNNLQNILLNNHNIQSTLLFNPKFEDLNKNEIYLFLQPENEDNNFIYNNEEDSWTTAIYPFIEKNLYNLSYKDFILSIKSFDLYSQVKLFNLYANNHKIQPFVSQGWIIKNCVPLEDIQATKNYNVDINTLKKIVNELNLKYFLYIDKKISLQFDSEFKLDIQTIKIVSSTQVEKNKLFGVLDLRILNQNVNGIEFEIQNFQMFINEEINSLDLNINLYNEKEFNDNYIFINNDYLIKSKDNNLMPFIICKKEIYENKDLDFMKTIESKILSDSADIVPRTYELFYPYIMPTNNKMLKTKGEKYNYLGCHIEFKNKSANIFMMLQNWGQKQKIPTNNRLENIQIFKMKDFEYKKANIQDNLELLKFYLSTLPFNYLNISELTKKSTLNKLCELIVNN